MDDIKNYNPAEAETLDSREVAAQASSSRHQWVYRKHETGH